MKILASLLLSFCLATAAAAQSINEADAAYSLYDVNKAEALYRQIAFGDDVSDRDRAKAHTELARIAWLVDDNPAQALAILRGSLSRDPDPCAAALLYSRIGNDLEASLTSDRLALRLSSQCLEVQPGIALEIVRSIQLQARRQSGPLRRSTARNALERFRQLPSAARLSARGSKLQLAIGMLARDADAALGGWRNYFWIPKGSSGPQAIDLPVESIINEGLAEAVSQDAALRLAGLLVRSGFYEDFRDYADLHRLAETSGDDWTRFEIYIDLRNNLAREVLAHDRRYARRGAAGEEAYEQRLSKILADASARLGSTGDPLEALRDEYGLWGTSPGKSNGVSGIHLGHIVGDEWKEVNQDGRSGTIRLITLDNMVHNSFSAWLMDGKSAPGGWAVNGAMIVQVRPRYLALIDDYAQLARPGLAREQAAEQVRLQRVRDRQNAEETPLAFFPSVQSALRLGAIDDLASEVRKTMDPSESFDLAFRRAYMEALVGSAITAHEGRHVLDQASCRGDAELGNAELEFRAKLSEIRFAASPRLALSSIYSPLFGGSSGHGIANKRLFKEYSDWVEAHATKIAGFDPSLAPLEQLYKLSNAQIRTVAQSLDASIIGICAD